MHLLKAIDNFVYDFAAISSNKPPKPNSKKLPKPSIASSLKWGTTATASLAAAVFFAYQCTQTHDLIPTTLFCAVSAIGMSQASYTATKIFIHHCKFVKY